MCVCVCARAHRRTHRNPFLFSKCLETQSKTQGLGFTSVPFYVCGLAGKNHLSPAAAKSSQQGPAFMLPHAAQLKTISTIQTLSAKSTSYRHWDMVCEHQRPFFTKKLRQALLSRSRCCDGDVFSVGFTAFIHSIGPHQVFVLQTRTLVWNMLEIHCWHLCRFKLAPKIHEEEMKIIRGKWLGFKIHRIQA